MSLKHRLKLQEKLEAFLGSKDVYYQPPANVRMNYPAIIYNRSRISANHANNRIYITHTKYDITIIGTDPDDELVENFLEAFGAYCAMDRQYIADGLYHWCFSLYYKN